MDTREANSNNFKSTNSIQEMKIHESKKSNSLSNRPKINLLNSKIENPRIQSKNFSNPKKSEDPKKATKSTKSKKSKPSIKSTKSKKSKPSKKYKTPKNPRIQKNSRKTPFKKVAKNTY